MTYKYNKKIDNNNKFKEQLNAVSSSRKKLMKKITSKQNGVSEKSNENQRETNSKTNIIIKADGSRVLMITTKIGGMESVMSLEISKPTDIQNDFNLADKLINKQDIDTTKIDNINNDGEI